VVADGIWEDWGGANFTTKESVFTLVQYYLFSCCSVLSEKYLSYNRKEGEPLLIFNLHPSLSSQLLLSEN
jgi:hypothetical protein